MLDWRKLIDNMRMWDPTGFTDWMKIIGCFACIIGAFVSLFYFASEGSVLGGFFTAGLLLYLAMKCLDTMSDELTRQAARYRQEQMNKKLNDGYLCPNCGARAGHKIDAVSKGVSVGVFGLASNQIGKTYRCAVCEYIW